MKKTPVYVWLLIWLLTQVISLFSITLLFSLGLILIEFLLYPLALAIGALLTALTAVWLSNRLVRDDLETPVNEVVLRCEGTAVILALILIAGYLANLLPAPAIIISSAAATVLAVAAVVFSQQLRQPPMTDMHRTRRIIIWLLVAFVSIPVVIFLASLVGWAGA